MFTISTREKYHSMIYVKGVNQGQLEKAVIGAHPIIQHYIDKLNLLDIFRTYIVSDKRLVITAPDCICVLIHNILTQPMAMYKLPEWLDAIDFKSMGFLQYQSAHFNDDRIARLLDCVYRSNRKQIFFTPDGRKVLFTRSKSGWVPENDAEYYDKWDLWEIYCTRLNHLH